MLPFNMIVIGAAILFFVMLYFLIKHHGAKEEKQKQIAEQNELLKESKEDVENIKADQAAKYTNDINGAHDRLRKYERD